LEKAAESQTYCDEVKGTLAQRGLQVTELSTAPPGPAGGPCIPPTIPRSTASRPHRFAASRRRAPPGRFEQCKLAAKASRRLGVTEHATFSGALAWPYLYPWPQRPPGLIETAFDELAKRWRPILDAFDAEGVNVCYEIHPGEDLHDGATFEMFLERVGGHKPLQHPLRSQPFHAAAARLPRLHRHLPRAHPHVMAGS